MAHGDIYPHLKDLDGSLAMLDLDAGGILGERNLSK